MKKPAIARRLRPRLLPVVLPVGAVLAPAAGLSGQEAEARAEPRAESVETWRWLGLGALGLAVLATLDDPARDLVLDVRGRTGDDVASFGRWYGDWHRSAPWLLGGLAVVGVVSGGDEGLREVGAIVTGVLSASMANEALNQASGRNRPSAELGPWHFTPFNGHASLGSGHTTYAFALAAAIDEVSDGGWSTPFYVAAAVTGLSRIYHDRHWLSDVAVGTAIGLFVGRRATRLATRALGVAAGPSPGATAWLDRIEPVAGAGFLGVRLRF